MTRRWAGIILVCTLGAGAVGGEEMGAGHIGFYPNDIAWGQGQPVLGHNCQRMAILGDKQHRLAACYLERDHLGGKGALSFSQMSPAQ